MKLLFSNAVIVPMTASSADSCKSFTGWVGVDDNRIVLVTQRADEAAAFRSSDPSLREIDCRGKALMPGLVNTHCHAAMTLQRSYADDIPLMEWLNDYIWPFESQQTVDEVALGAELGIVEMLSGGVTSFVDMYWHENRIAAVADRMGIRALLCPSCLDSNMEAFERDLELLLPRTTDRVRAGLGPHAPYTVSRENLLRCRALSEKYGLPVTIHVAETPAEMTAVRERTGTTPVRYLDSLGLLNERTIAAHCVHVDRADRDLLRERGVYVAHNPTSNMKIASGIAPISAFAREGVRCTIGTDGTCSNNDLDMWEEMRNAAFLAKVASMDPLVLPAYEVLRMATVDGARALGFGDDLGVIREGALADLILIDLQKPHLQPVHDLISNLVYCCKASDVGTVVVDGRILMENRRLAGVDLPALYAAANATAERIKQAVGKRDGVRP